MVSPVHGDYRRCQAETPLIVLSKLPRPVQTDKRKWSELLVAQLDAVALRIGFVVVRADDAPF
jgi:hypothetical protein